MITFCAGCGNDLLIMENEEAQLYRCSGCGTIWKEIENGKKLVIEKIS